MSGPENVRLRFPDGQELPVELVDEGVDDEGIHRWAAVVPWVPSQGSHLLADTLPARTAIVIRVEDEKPETGPPCPRCGEPMFKVRVNPYFDDSWVWGHGCEPT